MKIVADDGMRVIQERNDSNTPLVSYTRGRDLSGSFEGAGGIGGLLARSHGYSGGTGNWSTHNFYHADGNGNITYLVNSSQTVAASYRYDPYANTISSSGSLASANVYRFSSKELHVNSGLYYYGYRWYHPNLQRWLNRDPIGEWGGINLFEFVLNDPGNYADMFGLEVWVGEHPAFFNNDKNPVNHANIILRPENPEDFKDHPLFKDSGGKQATLGGQAFGGKRTWREPFGKLKSAPNFPGDSNIKTLIKLRCPPGQSDTQFINNLISAAAAYKDDKTYDPFPGGKKTFNSNSYVSGVLKAAGAAPPRFGGSKPGYDKPLPLDFSPKQDIESKKLP